MPPLTFSKVDTLEEGKETEAKLQNSELVPFISLWRTSGRILFVQSKKNGREYSEGILVVILYLD